MKFVWLFAVITIILSSCSKKVDTCNVTEIDGIKVYKNKNIPTVEKLDFNPQKEFALNEDSNNENYLSYFDPDFISSDSEGCIYIGDHGSTPRVNKYSKSGEFLNSFLKQGTGPGEVGIVSFLCVRNDTVFVGDGTTGSVSLFNPNGEFLSEMHPKGSLGTYQVNAIGKDKFICVMYTGAIVDGKEQYKVNWALLNWNFDLYKTLYSEIFDPANSSIPDEWSYVGSSKDKIYIGINDKVNYRIHVYNFEGELIEKIFKGYASIKFTEGEIKRISDYLVKTNQRKLNEKLIDKKRAVLGVYVDKNDNLIVHPAININKSENLGMVLDFFKNNIYLNTTVLKTEDPYYQCDFSTFIKFIDDRMLLIDGNRNVVEVYQY
ncbi:MAG: hypothetical protein GQ534_00065 [Candidatus Delongbacteria bacterium]|nr:hypothetical protein [Candidatus Delongbacteria bacterium]